MKTISTFALIPGFFLSCIVILSSCSKDGEEGLHLDASAGNDVNVKIGQLVTLNGNGSSDSQGAPFGFSWEFIQKPVGSDAEIEDSDTSNPQFTPDVPGKYKVELTISNTAESRDTVTVSAFQVAIVDGEYENPIPGPNVGIREFEVACGKLIATCEFTEIGGIEANKIAFYNGSAWSAMGCGLEEGSVYGMIEYNEELYVTGQFDEIGCIAANNIARWNCNTMEWDDVDGGLTGGDDPFGDALMVYKDELYVAGRFTQAGDVSVSNIAKWDGESWSAVGSIEGGSVRDLEVYKQKLYVGGFFTSVNGTNAEYIAAYDGTNWSTLGNRDELELKSTGVVKYMEEYKNVLYIAGEFTSGSHDIFELSTWDGASFDDFGRAFSLYPGNTISELKVVNDILYIGGDFRNVVADQAESVIQWDGETWGIMNNGISGTVLSIENYNSKIYIGGDFNGAGGKGAENISIWTEK